MTGTNCDLFTHKQSRSYLNHLVRICASDLQNCTNTCSLCRSINLLEDQLSSLTAAEVEAVPVYAIKAYRRSRGAAPLILKLVNRLRYLSSFTLRPPHPLYPMNKRVGGPPSVSGLFWRRKNRSSLLGTEHRTVQPTTSQSALLQGTFLNAGTEGNSMDPTFGRNGTM